MNNAQYGYRKEVTYTFNEAIEKITKSLNENGFGIISNIDIAQKIKEKTGEDFENYVILGACNPKLALSALKVETEVGLLLPCNVIVYEKSGQVTVSAILPSVAMGFVDNPALEAVASEVEPKLKTAINNC